VHLRLFGVTVTEGRGHSSRSTNFCELFEVGKIRDFFDFLVHVMDSRSIHVYRSSYTYGPGMDRAWDCLGISRSQVSWTLPVTSVCRFEQWHEVSRWPRFSGVTCSSGAPEQKCKDSPPRAPFPFHSLLTSPPLCNFVPGTGTRGPLHSGAPWTRHCYATADVWWSYDTVLPAFVFVRL